MTFFHPGALRIFAVLRYAGLAAGHATKVATDVIDLSPFAVSIRVANHLSDRFAERTLKVAPLYLHVKSYFLCDHLFEASGYLRQTIACDNHNAIRIAGIDRAQPGSCLQASDRPGQGNQASGGTSPSCLILASVIFPAILEK